MTTAPHATGPRTPAGKARSALNARKHGIFSAPVIPGVEHQADWEQHLADLEQSLFPHTPLEHLLVQRIAWDFWRLARLQRYECQSLAHAYQTSEDRLEQRQAASAALLTLLDPTTPSAPTLQELRAQAAHDAQLLEWTKAYCSGVQTSGTPAHRIPLLRWCARQAPSVLPARTPQETEQEYWARLAETAGILQQVLEQTALQQGVSLQVLEEQLMADFEQAVAGSTQAQARGEQALAAQQTRQLLPAPGMLDKLLRYETLLTRSSLRHLHELRTLQAHRAEQVVREGDGEYVPSQSTSIEHTQDCATNVPHLVSRAQDGVLCSTAPLASPSSAPPEYVAQKTSSLCKTNTPLTPAAAPPVAGVSTLLESARVPAPPAPRQRLLCETNSLPALAPAVSPQHTGTSARFPHTEAPFFTDPAALATFVQEVLQRHQKSHLGAHQRMKALSGGTPSEP